MDKYKINKGVTSERLMYYGFVVDNIDDNAKDKNYCLYRGLPSNTHMVVTIEEHKRKLVFRDGVKIFVGNINYSCSPETIKNNKFLGFSSIYDSYTETMDDLVESGILVKKLQKRKRK